MVSDPHRAGNKVAVLALGRHDRAVFGEGVGKNGRSPIVTPCRAAVLWRGSAAEVSVWETF